MPVLLGFIIAPLVAALGAVFKWVIATGVGMLLVRIVAALGVGMLVFNGVDMGLDWFVDRIRNELGSLGEMANFFGLLGIDVGVSIVTSAMSAAITMRTVGGTLKRFTMR